MTRTKLTTLALVTALTISTSGCIIHVGGHANNDRENADYSSVFGGVDITENRKVGDLSSVNGDITIQDKVIARDVSAVNGSIEIGNHAQLTEVSTVNGDIQAQTYVSVKGDVSTVNGSISFSANSQIDHDVTTLNGDIKLTNTLVGEDIKTKNGSITLKQGSVVTGDIEFESLDENTWWGNKTSEHNPPTLTIDDSSDVKGRIILRQVVVLEINNPALLAKVERRYRDQE